MLYNIDNSLNEISLTLDELQIQKKKSETTLALGYFYQTSYPMELIEPLENKEIGSTEHYKEKIRQMNNLLKAEKKSAYPLYYYKVIILQLCHLIMT